MSKSSQRGSRNRAVAFLPDGGYLVTERAGRLLRLDADGSIAAEIAGVPDVLFKGQGGLMDLVLDPGFAENGRIYLTHAARPVRMQRRFTPLVSTATC